MPCQRSTSMTMLNVSMEIKIKLELTTKQSRSLVVLFYYIIGSLRRRSTIQRRNTLQSLTYEPLREDHFKHIGLNNLAYVNEDDESAGNGRHTPTSDKSRRMSEPALIITPTRKYPAWEPVQEETELNSNQNNVNTSQDDPISTQNDCKKVSYPVWSNDWDYKF